MPEITPQQLDEYRTQQAIQAAISRHIHFDRPPLVIKVKPRKTRSDKAVAPLLTNNGMPPTVAA